MCLIACGFHAFVSYVSSKKNPYNTIPDKIFKNFVPQVLYLYVVHKH